MAPRSELDRLEHIDPDVDEAPKNIVFWHHKNDNSGRLKLDCLLIIHELVWLPVSVTKLEANAMLVESFLNVKRSLGAEMNEAFACKLG